MKKLIVISSCFLILLGCKTNTNKKSNLEGDLYYTWLKLGSFYGQPDSLYQNYIKLRDSLGIDRLRKEDSTSTAHIELLEKHGLVKSPFIYLKADNDSTFIIYMSKEDYKLITKYTYQDLIDKKKKIRLELEIEKLTNKLKLCKRIISIEQVNGETLQKQKKFKIDEYK
ncbi:hypothetical protein [Aquimarina spinulae]|uniref:hypothetical protein n=1 Tax=Aquimarina spinulae TaxID=1192023 RepID=UPI000D54D312|nr:hypothetical protein [Aquimarina spinulae]